jgi:hypothetical protein
MKTPQYPADFEVSYRFYSAQDERGRDSGAPEQGYRADFLYFEDEKLEFSTYMIWPLFLDTEGNLIPEKFKVEISGKANMYIIDSALRSIHQKRLTVGTKGYLVEGRKKVAECIVTKLIGLFTPRDHHTR